MASPTVTIKIPSVFANLPPFFDKTLPLILSAVSAFFLSALLFWDVCRSWRRKKHWIPGKHLILGALSLQLLGFVENPLVNISNEQKLDPEFLKKVFETLQHNQFLILGGRVVMCVLMGIILPDFFSSRAQSRRSDFIALVITAYTVVFHITYENVVISTSYENVVISQHGIDGSHNANNGSLLLNFIIFFTVLYVLCFLGTASMISDTIRKLVAHRIFDMPSPAEGQNTASWEEVEEKVVRLWVTAQTSQPQNIISRSIFTFSSTFFVTVCVVLYIVDLFNHGPPLKHLKVIVFLCQLVFISFGWVIVCWRCIAAVVFYPKCMSKEVLGQWAIFLPDYLLLQEPQNCFKHYLLTITAQLLCCSLYYPSVIISWILSFLFSNRFMQRLLKGAENDELNNGSGEDPDLKSTMPWEKSDEVYMASRKSIKMARARLIKFQTDAKNCNALISLLRNKTLQVLSYANNNNVAFQERTPKMMAVTLLTVIIQLSGFCGDAANQNIVTVTDCIDACKYAWTIMGHEEKKDAKAAIVNEGADILIHALVNQKSNKWLGLTLPINEYSDRTINTAKSALQELEEKVKEKAKSFLKYETVNWKATIAINNFKKVCDSINNVSVDNIEEMLHVIQSSLATVIWNCVSKVKAGIMEECRLEASADMEKKEKELWHLLKVAGMAKGITELDAAPPLLLDSRSDQSLNHSTLEICSLNLCHGCRSFSKIVVRG